MKTAKEYYVHLDSKKRVTLRGALYQYYNVKEYENGCIMLEPRELTVPDTISARTLKDMDKAISNYKPGYVSDPIDLSDFGQCENKISKHKCEFFLWPYSVATLTDEDCKNQNN